MKFENAGKLALAALAISAGPAAATTIDGWNTSNVVVAPTPADGVTASSVVYDRDVTGGAAGATTNGAISFEPPEAVSPGIKVVTNGPDLNPGQDIPNCVMASSVSTCEGDFQSGKRIKVRMEATGPIDLVFDTSAGSELDGTATTDPYRFFGKLKNNTGGSLSGFMIELGFGIGADFVAAQAGDGISFQQFLSPESVSQFPFGLFGDATTNPNHVLDGFFAAETTGYNVDFGATKIASTGFYGPYPSYFGEWLSLDQAPMGYFWDNDGDPATDAILMAWWNGSEWEQRRVEDGGFAASATPFIVSENDLLAAGYLQGAIEDVVNLNLNYNIAFDGYADGTPFTLRITGMPAPVPLPGAFALLAGALAAMGGLRLRRAAA